VLDLGRSSPAEIEQADGPPDVALDRHRAAGCNQRLQLTDVRPQQVFGSS
jgi:hypothetical protein